LLDSPIASQEEDWVSKKAGGFIKSSSMKELNLVSTTAYLALWGIKGLVQTEFACQC